MNHHFSYYKSAINNSNNSRNVYTKEFLKVVMVK